MLSSIYRYRRHTLKSSLKDAKYNINKWVVSTIAYYLGLVLYIFNMLSNIAVGFEILKMKLESLREIIIILLPVAIYIEH